MGANREYKVAFPKLQFLGKQPWIYGKKRASDRFFKSLPQNQPGFVEGSKDSVFSWLFSNPDTLRELYGALAGITLPPTVPITINTLEGVLFKARMNDISFTIGGRLVVLIEHQSTVNENMPLRLLLYIAKIYEKLTGNKDIYRGKRIPLPLPEFIVLYNGVAPCPDENTLKLSDSFSDPGELGLPRGDAALELVVKVYNINRGHNGPIIRRCETLEGYSIFIATVRGYEGEGKSREEAITAGIKECIGKNVEPFPKPGWFRERLWKKRPKARFFL